jgi:hypothetical protein
MYRAILAAFVLGGAIQAQHSLVFSMDSDELTLDDAGGLVEAGTIHPDETALVTPGPGAYSASVFQSMGAQWAFIGDADQDGDLVDIGTAGPGNGTDALFVKHFPALQPGDGPRDVYLSKENDSGFAGGFEDGDVFRFSAQGVLEVFVSEGQLLDALGQPSGMDLDLDAICQSPAGDLFVSFAEAEAAPGGTASAAALLRIPSGAIAYGVNGNVAIIAMGSAQIIAGQDEVGAWVLASGMQTSTGVAPGKPTNLTALELDPNGGAFEAPLIPGLFLPNVLFGWSGPSNDGAVLSTAGGGSLASLNAVPLASAGATTGAQLGLLPDAQGAGGLMGLAVIDERPAQQAAEIYPAALLTSASSLWSRVETSGVTPGGAVVVFADVGPAGVGAVLPALLLPGIGEAFTDGTVVIVGTVVANGLGYASRTLTLPDLVGTGMNLVFQTFDVGTFTVGTPAPVQYH